MVSKFNPGEPVSGQEGTSNSADKKSGRRKLGKFDLLRRLGHGAMGSVYLAKKEGSDQEVALKVLPPALARDREFLERFRREARLVLKLQHPNIVRAYEVGVSDGYHYIAMEYVEGNDLETLVEKNGKFKPDQVVKIAKEMAAATSAALTQGVVHRDIKPANIMLAKDGVAKMTDLGLAAPTADDQRVTQTGVAIGTPFYISPEQAVGERLVDFRADIYSLGASLYHLLIGEPPYPGDNAVVIMTQHVREPLIPPNKKDPSIPEGVSKLIEKMMAKKPDDRHASLDELAEDIAMVENGGMPTASGSKAAPVKKQSKPPRVKTEPMIDPDDIPADTLAATADGAELSDSEAKRSAVSERFALSVTTAPLWQKVALAVGVAACLILVGLILAQFL